MRVSKGNIYLSKEEYNNILSYDNVDYIIKSLNDRFSKSKGGNSNVFLIEDPQEGTEYVIKFSKYNLNDKDGVANYWDRIERFEREIEALNIARNNEFEFVVKILFDGNYDIGNQSFRYFVMEKADSDLTDYLKNTELAIQQRFLICTEILSGIKELHSKHIYHRDIKPDNILFINGTWKISDLGLIGHRDDDFKAKEIGMKIGPANWMSPEAFNKMYNEGPDCKNIHGFDCNLDDQSDIFQLGKLFWFIFQGNIPDGQLIRDDFKIEDDQVFAVLLNMLSHSKDRSTIEGIEAEFEKRYSVYII
ncbi:protein kinase domain-containing protein [Sphingobacterium siyangense]|uniref:protein kinase domain-containing protein n=1 Tax=Sphingobacterium siyangense TaxID=459529 RepID=UPI003C74A378